MQLAEMLKEDKRTLAETAKAIGVAGFRAVQRYRDGDRIPDRKRMRAIVVFSEGRVTPNDIYGLTDLIAECLERREKRLASRKTAREPHPELPFAEERAA